jgi:hypothetical protein
MDSFSQDANNSTPMNNANAFFILNIFNWINTHYHVG